MDTKEKIEHLRFIMNRFDHYYESINNKGNIYLTINAFTLGGGVTAFYTLIAKQQDCSFLVPFFITFLMCNVLSISFTLWAIWPYLTKAKEGNHSLHYFNDICLIGCDSLIKKWDTITGKELYHDILKQQDILAIGLNRKFRKLSWATIFLSLHIGVAILFVVTNINILNK